MRQIKPRKVLIIAVDGVAPRAKMNQQRSRRFRSAQEAAANLERARKKGDNVPSAEELFDSNCITPGTEFMEKLNAHFEYFIRKKVTVPHPLLFRPTPGVSPSLCLPRFLKMIFGKN